jgi:hypothetical protein
MEIADIAKSNDPATLKLWVGKQVKGHSINFGRPVQGELREFEPGQNPNPVSGSEFYVVMDGDDGERHHQLDLRYPHLAVSLIPEKQEGSQTLTTFDADEMSILRRHVASTIPFWSVGQFARAVLGELEGDEPRAEAFLRKLELLDPEEADEN